MTCEQLTCFLESKFIRCLLESKMNVTDALVQITTCEQLTCYLNKFTNAEAAPASIEVNATSADAPAGFKIFKKTDVEVCRLRLCVCVCECVCYT